MASSSNPCNERREDFVGLSRCAMTPEDCLLMSAPQQGIGDNSSTVGKQPIGEQSSNEPRRPLSGSVHHDTSSQSDVETFNGKIVYNPDGSAFIIENESVGGDSEDSSLDIPLQQEGSIVDGRGLTPPRGSEPIPQVVNAFHISRNPALYSALYGQACNLLQEKNKVTEVPVMHSYRVFSVRNKESASDEGARGNALSDDPDDEAKSTLESRNLPFLDHSSVPIKPILMCFICKLSFGFSKSFVSHAISEHNLSLSDEEHQMMSQKNTSAIIQGVGKDKEPLLSFLEPQSAPPALAKNVPLPLKTLLSASIATISSSGVNKTLSDIQKSCDSDRISEQCSLESQQNGPLELTTASSSRSTSENDMAINKLECNGPEKEDDDLNGKRLSPSLAASHDRPTSEGSSTGSSPSPGISPKMLMGAPPALTHSLLNASNLPASLQQMLAASGTICPQHPDGKTNGVECTKCDAILGSSRSLGGHMTMMHSRNSCKTLKCPKCNWHYKYQETLEIHMKEKHPENEMNCIYCLTNQPHPRLARGETYTCGYKPYRCDVCNYSTTTKGNLSIHMQSDKHINNIQELQNGTLAVGGAPPEHLMVAAAAAQQQQQHVQQPPISPAGASLHDVKKPITGPPPPPQPKPKATWRCDVCNYETNVARNLRIHMTSEKHTHNMMVLQQNVKHMQQLSALQQAGIDHPLFQFHPGLLMPPPDGNQTSSTPSSSAAAAAAAAGGGLQPEAALADMAYNHALLMMASQHHQQQQQLAAAQALAAAQQAKNTTSPTMDMEHPDPTLRLDISTDDTSQLFQCCVCGLFSVDTVEALGSHFQADRTRTREDEVLMAVAGSYICKLCSYKTNLKANFQLHCKTDKHLQRLQHVNHIKEGGQRNDWKLKYVNISNPVQVRCNACDYYTNSIHKLQLHSASPRHDVCARLFVYLVNLENILGRPSRYYTCTPCSFHCRKRSQLIGHVHSPKHHQRPRSLDDETFRDMFQVRELNENDQINFELDNDAKAAQSNADPSVESKPSPSQLANSMLKQALQTERLDEAAKSSNTHPCSLCNFTCNSESRLYHHIRTQHSPDSRSSQTNSRPQVQCPLCEDKFSDMAKIEVHLVETHNVKKDGVQRLLALVDTSPLTSSSTAEIDEVTSGTVEPMESDDAESSCGGRDSVKSNAAGSDDLTQEDLSCAICLRTFSSVDELFAHQTEQGHMELKQTSRGGGYACWRKSCGQLFATPQAVQVHFREIHLRTNKVSPTVSERHVYKYRCNQCSLAFKTIEKLELHSQYHAIRAATKCVLCERSFRSVAALQKHVEAAHADMTPEEQERYRISLLNNPLLTSGSGGVLDPQTTELLKKESNRDNDEEQMDTSDEQIDEETNVPDEDVINLIMSGQTEGKEQLIEDYINSPAIAEDGYNDPSRKYKCHRCKVAFTRQTYLTSHNKTLMHRKGEKLSYPMEKYLDPNRPYKCDICKESFTQKNILLVHYNSVSHLHKLKQSMKDGTNNNTITASPPLTGQPSPPSPSPIANNNNNETDAKKPFKCNICKVSYSQGSTLDIHMRSVLHQTKASKLQELAQSGLLDLSAPLIERPENATPEDMSPAAPQKSLSDLLTSHKNDEASTSIEAQLKQQQEVANTFQQALNAAALAAAAAAGASPQAIQGLLTCNRCNTFCVSAEALAQHQQVQCPFNNNNAMALLQKQQQQQHQQHQQQQQQQQQVAAQLLQQQLIAAAVAANDSQQQNDASAQQLLKIKPILPRTKPPMYKHLLESIGFDVVMQFNEYNQRRMRREAEKREAARLAAEQENEGKESIAENDVPESTQPKEEKVDLPEINRSKCSFCGKEFSSIWVLKAHREEIHRDVVPVDFVTKVADEFRSEYDRKNATGSEEDVSAEQQPSAPQQIIKENSVEPQVPPPPSTPKNDSPTVSLKRPASSQSVSGSSKRSATPSSTKNSAPPPNQQSSENAINPEDAAAQMAAQIQFSQILMSMGLGMGLPMGMPPNMQQFAAAMNLHPPLFPVVMPPHMDPLVAQAFNHPMMSGDPAAFLAAQQKLVQQQQQQIAAAAAAQQAQAAQQQKRARTRITDDQLKILRAYFDINNSPTEEQLNEMSDKSGLPLKVIKHWFRNTLFKERQRNKDSPYNFNNPPSTYLNLEEYEKTGEAKVIPISEVSGSTVSNQQESQPDNKPSEEAADLSTVKKEDEIKKETPPPPPIQVNVKRETDTPKPESSQQQAAAVAAAAAAAQQQHQIMMMAMMINNSNASSTDDSRDGSLMNGEQRSITPSKPDLSKLQVAHHSSPAEFPRHPLGSAEQHPILQHGFMMERPSAGTTPTSIHPQTSNPGSTGTSSGKRANRTRFTDYQIKVLQEFFESNAYPKDDDLEYLSKLLNLSPRVIVVWFQNARQKARKVYENQPPVVPSEDDQNSGRFQRTPGLNYQCKKCLQVFQRYYELIKHQKSSCFKDENPLALQLKSVMQQQSQSNDGDRPESSIGSHNSNPSPPQTPEAPSTPKSSGSSGATAQQNTYRCDKCSLVFPRFDLWREHQLVHLMNPNLFGTFPVNTSFGMLQIEGQQDQQTTEQEQQQAATRPQTPPSQPDNLSMQTSPTSPWKRSRPDESDDQSLRDSSGGETSPRDKRLRTTILPEQLDYLYQKYQLESNPSRKMLENIARDVGLKKRVVQVWFQNTRARERKGQFRAHQQVIHKRCPFCRALFKARSALESHLATRHADLYSKGDLNIDAFPDGDAENSNPDTPTSSASEENKAVLFNSTAPSVGGDSQNARKFYEESFKKYLDDLSSPTDLSCRQQQGVASRSSGDMPAAVGGEAPLDLSRPDGIEKSLDLRMYSDDAHSETHSESTTDNLDLEDSVSFFESAPTSPTSSIHGSSNAGQIISATSTVAATNVQGGQQPPPRPISGASKRFRTQMSTVQLKVMKSIFNDYKTPSMSECDHLGKEIGLPKRVVQVWFQNARAKEKKAKLAMSKSLGGELPSDPKPPEECALCGIKYQHQFSSTSMQEHLFSRRHIDALKIHIEMTKSNDGDDSVSIPSDFMSSSSNHATESSAPSTATTTTPSLVQQLQMLGVPPKGISSDDALRKLAVAAVGDDRKDSGGNGESGLAASDNGNLFPYMYPVAPTGLQNFFGQNPSATATSFMQPTSLFSGGQSTAPKSVGMGAAPFEPTGAFGGTHLSLLPLPQNALNEIKQKLSQQKSTFVRISSEHLNREELRRLLNCESDIACACEVEAEVGFLCKQCQLVFPAESLCTTHQLSTCSPSGKTQQNDFKPILRLLQHVWECGRCHERCTTSLEFKFHCESDRHQTKAVNANGTPVVFANGPTSFASAQAIESVQQILNGLEASKTDIGTAAKITARTFVEPTASTASS